jgi:hypothetical protein
MLSPAGSDGDTL